MNELTIELNEQQKEGLKIAAERIRRREPYTCISGFAGTGKSTLVAWIIAELGFHPWEVAYCAYTGKAALVLKNKGNDGATTIHKLLYESYPLPNGGFKNIPKKFIGYYKLIVIDEISMVPDQLFQQLLKHHIPIIGLGDPFQLPPIMDGNHLLDNPNVMLTQIMRQEEDSEIVKLSMKIRNMEPFDNFKGEHAQVINQQELFTGHYQWADQILCATNKTRRSVNDICRRLYGFEGELQDGERLICLNNYWGCVTETGDTLVNGSTGIVEMVNEIPRNILGVPEYRAHFMAEGSLMPFDSIPIDKVYLETGERCLTDKQMYRCKRKFLIPMLFDFGYCITCHKAQGGEWDNILVIEERFPFEKEEHARWLYTAVTRAAKKLVIAR